MPRQTFDHLFGAAPIVRTQAPGRVNLIGEHTDYNGGFVLPAAIPQRTTVELGPRRDTEVCLFSVQFPDRGVIKYALGRETRDGTWSDYVKGMTRVLASAGELQGFNARVDSTIPVGSGLSSSAALEIAVGRAIREASHLPLDDVALARAGQRAENEFVGAPVGIMDQMACSLADTTAALFLDTRSLDYSRVPIPSSAALLVIDSGVTHRHAGGEYVTRRRECSEAAARLGVELLRDISPEQLSVVERLPEPLNRRARHVVTENARVLLTVDALRAGDLTRAGAHFIESHASMRDDFDVSTALVDVLVDLSTRVQGVYGARMTGGGFGGSIVVLADREAAAHAAAEIVEKYREVAGGRGTVLVPIGG
jgi:galactokinase